MIGSVRYCQDNRDIYIIIGKENNNFYKTYWYEIGYSSDDIDDIKKDIEIKKISPNLIKKTNLPNFLRLMKVAYETSND